MPPTSFEHAKLKAVAPNTKQKNKYMERQKPGTKTPNLK